MQKSGEPVICRQGPRFWVQKILGSPPAYRFSIRLMEAETWSVFSEPQARPKSVLVTQRAVSPSMIEPMPQLALLGGQVFGIMGVLPGM